MKHIYILQIPGRAALKRLSTAALLAAVPPVFFFFLSSCSYKVGAAGGSNPMKADTLSVLREKSYGDTAKPADRAVDSASYSLGGAAPSVNGGGAASEPQKAAYPEVSYPTPNYDSVAVNEVRGVVLHHTAEPTIERSLAVLTSPEKQVGAHVVIDTDGTRYVMCLPRVVTWHAGKSLLNGREKCNFFTIGIEFQGNTLERPLTSEQIASGVEYLLPLIAQYHIPVENIVTHQMVRAAYKAKHPRERVYDKPDITQTEYRRFMAALMRALRQQ